MEIVNIEARTFEAMLSAFRTFADRLDTLCRLYGDMEEKKWLDNQEVCLLLKVSPRTLQTLRDNGTLAYTQICHKTYYKPEDVESIIRIVEEYGRGSFSLYRIDGDGEGCHIRIGTKECRFMSEGCPHILHVMGWGRYMRN